jgi:hypothetical protein
MRGTHLDANSRQRSHNSRNIRSLDCECSNRGILSAKRLLEQELRSLHCLSCLSLLIVYCISRLAGHGTLRGFNYSKFAHGRSPMLQNSTYKACLSVSQSQTAMQSIKASGLWGWWMNAVGQPQYQHRGLSSAWQLAHYVHTIVGPFSYPGLPTTWVHRTSNRPE